MIENFEKSFFFVNICLVHLCCCQSPSAVNLCICRSVHFHALTLYLQRRLIQSPPYYLKTSFCSTFLPSLLFSYLFPLFPFPSSQPIIFSIHTPKIISLMYHKPKVVDAPYLYKKFLSLKSNKWCGMLGILLLRHAVLYQ